MASFSTPSLSIVLYSATQSLIDTFIIMAQIPVACLGGVLGLLFTGTPFSVSAGVGFISIFGIATMDGILLSFYIRQLWEQEGRQFLDAIIAGSDRRLRATMMTDLVDAFGLLLAALSTKIGAQTQKPLAIVVIGGALAHDRNASLATGPDLSMPSPLATSEWTRPPFSGTECVRFEYHTPCHGGRGLKNA